MPAGRPLMPLSEPPPTPASVVADLCEAIAGRLLYLEQSPNKHDFAFIGLQKAKLTAAKRALEIIRRSQERAAKV